ncbi:hypothetical protein DN062_15330 [Nitrincola tibetensis]|uniref:Transposase IS66 central domain-containing protein n=1 Tax=Nitrincola tibetensis TaxID=2219697 RepID=A0A364NIP0_9GAMM|nr:hypothetical protein DN062_15330 [Nitrincola tibetensis]
MDLLCPIVEAQLVNILFRKVLAMDETPINAGKAKKCKLKQGWFWPLYCDQDEVVFTFSSSRGQQHIENIMKHQLNGTLISDGYYVYASYVAKNEGVI